MKRSPLFYVGDKYKLMSQLLKVFPKGINRLIEPFVGGGSVFLNTKANEYLVNDNDVYIIKLHNFLCSYKNRREEFFTIFESKIREYNFSASYLGINVSDELKKKHVKTYYAVYNKKAYIRLRNDFNNNKKDIMLLYILLIYGFNHSIRFNKSGEFNLPVGNVDYNKNVKKALSDYFDFIDTVEKIDFVCEDFETFLDKIEFQEGDFVYLDPPYIISDSEYNKYWKRDDEKRLLNVLDKLNKKGVRFALSNVIKHKERENTILKKWSENYNKVRIKSNYISFNDNTVKKTTKEVLIFNYEKSNV